MRIDPGEVTASWRTTAGALSSRVLPCRVLSSILSSRATRRAVASASSPTASSLPPSFSSSRPTAMASATKASEDEKDSPREVTAGAGGAPRTAPPPPHPRVTEKRGGRGLGSSSARSPTPLEPPPPAPAKRLLRSAAPAAPPWLASAAVRSTPLAPCAAASAFAFGLWPPSSPPESTLSRSPGSWLKAARNPARTWVRAASRRAASSSDAPFAAAPLAALALVRPLGLKKASSLALVTRLDGSPGRQSTTPPLAPLAFAPLAAPLAL
mmetsp:Transcript_6687/g.15331  ORF Transcript_6687/g.15331 Transcript_6687/m.15331 type:complete len:268 (+) Transcript_6687:28-831(+)